MTNLKYKLTSPMLMWVIIAVGAGILWLVVPDSRLFNSGILGWVFLVLGIINLLYVGLAAKRVHKQAAQNVEKIDKIITEGAYGVVRHPIYAADILFFLCVFVFYPTTVVLAIVAWAIIIFVFWAGLEERMLEDKFMEDYRQYKQRVPMLVPNFKKRQ